MASNKFLFSGLMIVVLLSCELKKEKSEPQCPKQVEVIDPQTSLQSDHLVLDSEKSTKVIRILRVFMQTEQTYSFMVETVESQRAVLLTVSNVIPEFLFDVPVGEYDWALITFDKETRTFKLQMHLHSKDDIISSGAGVPLE